VVTASAPQRIGVIGGTGALGRGLAYRLSRSGASVTIGSRDAERARATAQSLGAEVRGLSNAECASECDLGVVAVPFDAHAGLLESLAAQLRGKVVVDCVNPLAFDAQGARAVPVPEGSAAQQAQAVLAASAVVGAFHHVSAQLLLDADLERIDSDVLVVGDDRAATDIVQALVDTIPGMRGIYAGPLRNAAQVEALTATLISVNRRYRTHAGVRITGV
jgi:NADPH-dependent F420 reductase